MSVLLLFLRRENESCTVLMRHWCYETAAGSLTASEKPESQNLFYTAMRVLFIMLKYTRASLPE